MRTNDCELFDRALAEIVGDVPEPRWEQRSRNGGGYGRLFLGVDDLSSDWWETRSSVQRSYSQLVAARAGLRVRVELQPAARADIVRELQRDWDGREQGGALVGRTTENGIVIQEAGGIGLGVSTPRGDSWFEPPLTRYLDLAAACGADLVGSWHSHRHSTVVSAMDHRCWASVRNALGARAYVGVIVAPRQWHDRHELGLWNDPQFGVYTVTERGCKRVALEKPQRARCARL